MFLRATVLLACGVSVAFAAKDPTKFPLRVTIIQVDEPMDMAGVPPSLYSNSHPAHGHGYGNVIDGEDARGFAFTYECDQRLTATMATGAYAGRWKTPTLRLEILGAVVGAKKQADCELKTTLHAGILEKINGSIVEVSQADLKHRIELHKRLEELAHPTDTELAHFPLRLMLLQSDWQPNKYVGGVTGNGRGNLVINTPAGANLRAVDFVALCPVALRNTVAQGAYEARWLQESTKLLVQAHAVGGGGASQCEFTTTLNADRVYAQTTSGELAVVSQGDYALLAAKPVVLPPTSIHPQIKPLLNNGDIATLNTAGMSSKVILAKIAESDCAFDTSPRALEMLKKASVPDEVLVEMIKCSSRTH